MARWVGLGIVVIRRWTGSIRISYINIKQSYYCLIFVMKMCTSETNIFILKQAPGAHSLTVCHVAFCLDAPNLMSPCVVSLWCHLQHNPIMWNPVCLLYMNGVVQDCSISSALGMKLQHSCVTPSILSWSFASQCPVCFNLLIMKQS